MFCPDMSSVNSYSELIDKVCQQTRYLYTLFLESRTKLIKELSGFFLIKFNYIIIKLTTDLVIGEVPPVTEKISEVELSKIKEQRNRFDDVCWLIVNMFKLASITEDKRKRNEILLLLNRAENIYLDLVFSTVFNEDIDYDHVDKELTKIKEELQEIIKA